MLGDGAARQVKAVALADFDAYVAFLHGFPRWGLAPLLPSGGAPDLPSDRKLLTTAARVVRLVASSERQRLARERMPATRVARRLGIDADHLTGDDYQPSEGDLAVVMAWALEARSRLVAVRETVRLSQRNPEAVRGISERVADEMGRRLVEVAKQRIAADVETT
jgi:hypothetical protein